MHIFMLVNYYDFTLIYSQNETLPNNVPLLMYRDPTKDLCHTSKVKMKALGISL